MGPPSEIIQAMITASLGVFSIASAFEGWIVERIGVFERGALMLAGVLMIVPELMSDLIGIAILGIILLLNYRRKSMRSQS
jgi:TRAP-type uncharacterized transport system fused permease subunit